MRRAAGGCLWERRRLEKWERTGQVESRGRGETCRKRQKRLYCSEKVRFGRAFLLTCRLLARKRPFPQKRSPPEGACQPLCSAKRPPRPLVGDRRGFQFPRLLSHPSKRRPPNKVHLKRCALRHAAAAPPHGAPHPTPLPPRPLPTQKRRTAYAARRQFSVKIREALNKSRHTSCLHIFRLIARKLLEIHQVFLRHFHTITGGGFRLRKICLCDLHTRFNQHFLILRS